MGLGVEEATARRVRTMEIYDMMREGDWRGVCNSFQGSDEFREARLVWTRPCAASLAWLHTQLREQGIAQCGLWLRHL